MRNRGLGSEVRDTGLGERVYYRVFVRLGARQRGPPIPSPPPPPPPPPFPSPFQPLSLSLCSTTCIPVSIIPAALFVCTCKCTRVLCLPMPHHHHHQHQRFRSVQPVFLHEALNGHESELKARCSRIEPTFLWIPWKTFLSPFRRTRVRLLVFSN